jgi:2-(1,2-epoxy-1,2-dihydrophenyl)acetyl-CoA isomerase
MSKIIFEQQGRVSRITINDQEKRNSISRATASELRDAVARAASDESRVVVLTGAGEYFCSGGDVSSNHSEDVSQYIRKVVNPLIMGIREMKKPVVARVHGPAMGLGCNLALACDMIIASAEAQFGQIFVRVALMPEGGSTFLLPRLLGHARAFEWLTTGNAIDAKAALEMGLINSVVPFKKLDAGIEETVERLASAPPLVVAGIKKALGFSLSHTLAECLEFEAVHQKECLESEDFLEGRAAFLAKRKPEFKGK